MPDRPSIPTKLWRELSLEISPAMVSGFDIEGVVGFSSKQSRLLSLPREFRIHKSDHNFAIMTTTAGLGLYGELDRMVEGLLPLTTAPIWDYNIPDYDSTLYAVRAAAFFTQQAGRDDLSRKLEPLLDVPAFYDPLPITMTSQMLSQDLDLTVEERDELRHITPAGWVERYVDAVAAFARAHVLGGSEEYPPARLLREINRFAAKIFSTPGYEPFNERHYPVR